MVVWYSSKLHPLDLYPSFFRNSPKPYPEEFEQAKQKIIPFHFFSSEKVYFQDQLDHEAMVAIIKFVPSNKLSKQEKKDISSVKNSFTNPKGLSTLLVPQDLGVGKCGKLDRKNQRTLLKYLENI